MTADRRAVMAGALAAGFALCERANAAPGPGGLDDKTRTWLRFICDLSGRTTYGVLRGQVWGFKPQADDLTTETFAKRLYGYYGLAVRKAQSQPDGSIAMRFKGWSFYTDSETGAVITELVNPYTGKTVQCPPLSGPESKAVYGAGPAAPLDLREKRLGPHAWVDLTRVSRFKPADTTWFKLEADMTSYACRATDLDSRRTFVPSTWAHNLVAEWQTWMKMHGEPGHILFKGDGAAFTDPDDIPADLAAAIDKHFPGGRALVTAWE
jgi:hypothetical protein